MKKTSYLVALMILCIYCACTPDIPINDSGTGLKNPPVVISSDSSSSDSLSEYRQSQSSSKISFTSTTSGSSASKTSNSSGSSISQNNSISVSSLSSSSVLSKTTFGIYTETYPVNVSWDETEHMNVWNDNYGGGYCDFGPDNEVYSDSYESLFMIARTNGDGANDDGITNSWFGLGFQCDNPRDISFYTNGYLNFSYKSLSGVTKIGIKGGYNKTNERWIYLADLTNLYNLKTDDTWCDVKIPIKEFHSASQVPLCYTNITELFMIVADKSNYSDGRVWNIDNIYYSLE